MNVFGAFTFGSLIKTFLPGLIWLVALSALWRDAHHIVPFVPPPQTFVDTEQNGLVLAVPAALLLGLLSNIVVFMGVNDRLVRNPVKARHPALAGLYQVLSDRLKADAWAALGSTNPALRPAFVKHSDAEMLMLHDLGVPTLSYVREQYWYHLEFQVNLLLAVAALALGTAAAPAKLDGFADAPARTLARAAVELLILAGFAALLLTAARRNYHRHLEKMCSLMGAAIGHYGAVLPAPPVPTPPAPAPQAKRGASATRGSWATRWMKAAR